MAINYRRSVGAIAIVGALAAGYYFLVSRNPNLERAQAVIGHIEEKGVPTLLDPLAKSVDFQQNPEDSGQYTVTMHPGEKNLLSIMAVYELPKDGSMIIATMHDGSPTENPDGILNYLTLRRDVLEIVPKVVNLKNSTVNRDAQKLYSISLEEIARKIPPKTR